MKTKDEMTQEDWALVPIHDGYAHTLVLEAARLLADTHPSSVHIVLVPVPEIPGFGLHKDLDVLFYNPDMTKQICLDNLCRIMSQIFHAHAMNFFARHAPPPETVLH